DTNNNYSQKNNIEIKVKPSLMEDLIAHPTKPSKTTNINTEYKRKDKSLPNKSEVKKKMLSMETTSTSLFIETENTMCNIEIES
ncbi:12358_t:CDS:1, partial [Dentiscutata erythropus]